MFRLRLLMVADQIPIHKLTSLLFRETIPCRLPRDLKAQPSPLPVGLLAMPMRPLPGFEAHLPAVLELPVHVAM